MKLLPPRRWSPGWAGEAVPGGRLRSLAALLMLAAAPPVLALDCPPVQVGKPEGNYIVPGVQGAIVYRRLGADELALDAYVQRRGDLRPAVLVVHGGGWTSGSRIAFVGQILETLTRAGFNWFAPDYRLGGLPSYADALDDLRSALTFVRCHAAEFRIDPERIAIVGEDAGAHLAALLAAEKPPGLRAAALLGGFYDLPALPALRASAPPDVLSRASPMRTISAWGPGGPGGPQSPPGSRGAADSLRRPVGGPGGPQSPPGSRGAADSLRRPVKMPALLAIHGAADPEVPPEQAARFCEAVRGQGGRCGFLPVEEAIHRVENWRPSQWGYKARLVEFLSERLGLARPDHEPHRGRLQKDVVYSPEHGLGLDAYVPPGTGPFPGVIVVHGGGWEAGDKVTYVTPVFEPLARAGFAWFSIDYRLTPAVRHPEQLRDLRRAIAFVRRHARRFRVDPGRLALLGESASGQMVAQVATEDRDLAAAVSFYGVYDFLPLVTDAAPRSLLARLFGLPALDEQARATLRRYSPAYHVSKATAPLLLVHGTNERLWAQGLDMRDRLAAAGAPHELHAVEGAPHGMENWEGRPEWTGYKARLVEWLRARGRR